ncbi:SDR family NAD(P)-dependent oxidoreductase [Streptomyces sp. SID13031]|uniref:SDR family oxidoreductase n=1 Tax=Streptomyces sp. SID13031 TaxID=2706046 RepID=UPI0013C753E6|nr:SDR family NAD(P)-dependent oxidoreductase [Streptomyces sp. SID13031]NEA34447.1 SDR family NAD(P)-dependent oxidoreductase [Streptomyces sp. SID13031]
MKTTGNTIFITGGTSGLGLGLALRFHALGNKVIIGGRRKELLDEIAAEHAGIGTVVLDVDDPASIQAAYDEVTSSYPELNAVLTMSGIMHPENLLDPGHLDTAEATITTNLLGTIRTLAKFTPYLMAKQKATILTVSSGLAFVPLAFTPTYNATKAAIHSYTQSLRIQLAGTAVQVIELIPPAVQTALMGQQNDERAMPLEEYLAETMTLLADQPDAAEITVQRVGFLRDAERENRYDQTVAAVNAH